MKVPDQLRSGETFCKRDGNKDLQQNPNGLTACDWSIAPVIAQVAQWVMSG